jgi:hypothetical protein
LLPEVPQDRIQERQGELTMPPTLKMKTFVVTLTIARPLFEVAMFGSPATYTEQRRIHGYTLKDAKRRAGIQ